MQKRTASFQFVLEIRELLATRFGALIVLAPDVDTNLGIRQVRQ